jgi:hypothetical protein
MLICRNVVVIDRDCQDKFASEMVVEPASNIRFLPFNEVLFLPVSYQRLYACIVSE